MRKPCIGSVFTFITMGLQAITAIVYFQCYYGFISNGYGAFDMPAMLFLIAGAALNLLLVLWKKATVAPFVSGLCSFLAVLFYIYGIYMYISVMIAGIDATWNVTFFVVSGLFVMTLLVNIVNIFLKQESSPQEPKR